MITNSQLNTIDLNVEVKELVCSIDTRISALSNRKLIGVKFGDKKFKVHRKTIFILSFYRKLLLDKVSDSRCLMAYDLDTIISNIKQYLMSGKISRMSIKDNYDYEVEKCRPINYTVIYQQFGDNIYYNLTNNITNINSGSNTSWENPEW